MNRLLCLLSVFIFLNACSDDDNENSGSGLSIDENATIEDITGVFTLFEWESKESISIPCELSSYTIEFYNNSRGVESNCATNLSGFSWTLKKGHIIFEFDTDRNIKAYLIKDKRGHQLIVEEGRNKKYYRNYNPVNFLESLNLKDIEGDVEINKSYQLNLFYLPSDLTNIEFKLTSSNTDLARILNKTLYTSTDGGRVKILLQAGILKDSIYIDIKEPENYRFGYRFGSSLIDVKPEKVESDYFAYNIILNKNSLIRGFCFDENKLVSLRSCYTKGFEGENYFLKEVLSLNPPQNINFVTSKITNQRVLEQDSLSWEYQKFKILVRNGELYLKGRENESSKFIIEYSQAN